MTRRIKGTFGNIDAHRTQLLELVEQRQRNCAGAGTKIDEVGDTMLFNTLTQERDRQFHQGFGVRTRLERIGR